MATLVHTTEPVDQQNWEISRDAFVPQPTRRIVRGWDRAPVSARAPRLQGQKVWKKAGTKTTSVERIEDDIQDELEKDGAGARKKSRTLTSKENITNAMWAEETPSELAENIKFTSDISEEQVENGNSPVTPIISYSQANVQIPLIQNDDAASINYQDSTAAVLQFIPRKRTNADHVITPKRPLRQTKLDNKDQRPSAIEKPNDTVAKKTRLRKSLRKSMIADPSASASKAKIVGGNRRFSSAEHLHKVEGVTSSGKAPEIAMGNLFTRVSPSSMKSARRSISHAEQTLSVDCPTLQSTELCLPNATSSITRIPANSAISKEQVTPIEPAELPILGDTAECDITVPNPIPPLEATPKVEAPLCQFSQTSVSRESNAVEPPGTSTNTIKDVEPARAEFLEEIAIKIVETAHDRTINVCESQKRISEPPTPILTNQTVECQDTSIDDGESLVNSTNFPIDSGNTSSSEPGDKILQAESTISSDEPAALDARQDLQIVEAPDGSDSSNLATVYDHDDTDMLRSFLTRVKANKAAKNPPRRKRSLPHSPLRIPLGDLDNNASPSPLQLQEGNALGAAEPSPSKRKKKPSPLSQCQDEPEPEPRRSSRTKPPTKEVMAAPSFIPVRRFGQDTDTTVTLKRNEEKELAALTRVNTRKNKGNALPALEVLVKKSEEKDDPVMRQRLLKEVFEEKMEREKQNKERKGQEKKTVTWAEELAQFQALSKTKSEEIIEDEKNEKIEKNEKTVVVQGAGDKKQGAVRVGVRSKVALGMVLNGTPAPKRKMRGRV